MEYPRSSGIENPNLEHPAEFPDVTVLDRDLPIEQIITVPPVAVFEILSPGDTMSRILVKLGDYEQMAIANIFVVDPASEME